MNSKRQQFIEEFKKLKEQGAFGRYSSTGSFYNKDSPASVFNIKLELSGLVGYYIADTIRSENKPEIKKAKVQGITQFVDNNPYMWSRDLTYKIVRLFETKKEAVEYFRQYLEYKIRQYQKALDKNQRLKDKRQEQIKIALSLLSESDGPT